MAVRGISRCGACKTFNTPHTHFERLGKLVSWKKPRTIFVQSMGDLFHDSVPGSWIKAVFEACEAAPWHTYLFLTKNPARYLQLAEQGKLPAGSNCWYGTTVNNSADFIPPCRAERLAELRKRHRANTFLSIEPLTDRLKGIALCNLKCFHGVIAGAMTGPGSKKYRPEREWIEDICAKADESGIPVFMKDSLIQVMGEENMRRELPWEKGTEK
jgi:protein gp37